MKKKFMPLICLLSLLVLMSNCKKDKTDSKENFEMNGAKFGTLQEVFNAIGDGQTADIKLLKDAEGDGAVLPEGKNALIFLDFGEFCYELNEGKPIDLGDSDAILSANGGAVNGSSSFIKSKGGSLSFEGDLDLEVNIETASETDFGESFTGSFKGNLTVDGCEVYFACPEATVDIHQLTVKGENACVQVIEAPQGGMKIEKVISTLPHPVCAMEPNAATIGEGAQLHVHTFIQSEKEATCCTLKEIVHTCSECGFSYEDADVEGGYGPCPIEDLVPYNEVPQGDTTFGYAEHWLCPHCGKVYDDANGSNEISGDYLFLPYNMEAGYPFIYDFANLEAAGLGGVDIFSIVSGIFTIVGFFSSTGMAIPGLIDNPLPFTDLNAKIDAISRQVSEINSKLDALLREVKAIDAKRIIQDRQGVFNHFMMYTMPTMSAIDSIFRIASIEEEEKEEQIRQLVKTWGESMYYGTMTYDLAVNHMMQYYNTGTGNVPQCFEALSNTAFLWEHQGYPMRKQAMLSDVVLSGCSFVLAYMYNMDIREESTIPGGNKPKYLKGMETVLNNYKLTIKQDMYRMRVRQEKLIKINMGGPDGTCFEKDLRHTDVYHWLELHWRDRTNCRFPRLNQDGAAVRTCENIISDFGGLPFTRMMADAIVTQYNNKHQQPLASMWHYLIDSIGFNQGSTLVYHRLWVRDDTGFTFGHDNNDVSLPLYGPFYWRAYKSGFTHDWFGVRSVIPDNGIGMERYLVLVNPWINTGRPGYIQAFGTDGAGYLYTPASLKTVPADTTITIVQPWR